MLSTSCSLSVMAESVLYCGDAGSTFVCPRHCSVLVVWPPIVPQPRRPFCCTDMMMMLPRVTPFQVKLDNKPCLCSVYLCVVRARDVIVFVWVGHLRILASPSSPSGMVYHLYTCVSCLGWVTCGRRLQLCHRRSDRRRIGL